MMARSKRFKSLVKLAQNTEREAAKALGRALQQLSANIEQLEQLFTYRDEYSKKLTDVGNNGISRNQFSEFREFIYKINQAIEKQELVIEESKQELENRKSYWFAKRGHSKALDMVLDSYLDDERKQAEKREQREIDDRPRVNK